MSIENITYTLSMLDNMPENVIVISGGSLLSRRHISTPPDMTTVIRDPQDPILLHEILSEEMQPEHRLLLTDQTGSREIKLADLAADETILNGVRYLIIPPLPENTSFESGHSSA